MLSHILLHCADSSAPSKVNQMLYPLEVTAENFIADIVKKEHIQTTKSFFGKRRPIGDPCEWKRVTCKDSELREIKWSSLGLGGSFAMEWFPRTLESFFCNKNKITGALSLEHLPETLTFFEIAQNQLRGEIDFAHFPNHLRIFSIQQNQFTGSFNVQDIPNDALPEYIDISENQFTGSVNFAALPRSLRTLNLSDNQLSGTLDLPALDECGALEQLVLRKSGFEGKLNLHESVFLTRVRGFDISENGFTGEVHVENLVRNGVQRFWLFDISLNRFEVEIGDAAYENVVNFFSGQQGAPNAPRGPRKVKTRAGG